jgi:putative endonuclease
MPRANDPSMLTRWGFGAAPEDPRVRGVWAEARVAWRYRLRGWRIAERNWIGDGGELDIVASRWWTLVVVEVRVRPDHDAALVSIDAAKLRRTMTAAQAFVARHDLQAYRLRFDLALVDARGRIRIRRDCTAPGHGEGGA